MTFTEPGAPSARMGKVITWVMGVLGAVLAAVIVAALGIDNWGDNNSDPTSSTTPQITTDALSASEQTTPPRVPTPASSIDRTGYYFGRAYNASAGISSDVSFVLNSIDKDGTAVATVEWAHPLDGKGTLEGVVDGEVVYFEGQIEGDPAPWNAVINCGFSGPDTIECNYTVVQAVAGNQLPQVGSFEASR